LLVFVSDTQQSPAVYFQVFYSSNNLKEFFVEQNVGNAFDQQSGQFIVPYTGIYVFNVSCIIDFQRLQNVQFMVEDVPISLNPSVKDITVNGLSTVLTLEKGKKVAVANFTEFVTFRGALLHILK
jgi:hypothetical protein